MKKSLARFSSNPATLAEAKLVVKLRGHRWSRRIKTTREEKSSIAQAPETNDFGIAALTYAKIKLVLLHKPTFATVDGTTRKEIKKGMLVGIIQKHHQRTGEITEGFVQDILTKSSFHPHGIKVRLKSREVGRVQEIIDNMDD